MPSAEEKYGPKLPMYVCYASSEDEVRPITALRNQVQTSSGWQSSKHCSYPQELGFRFDGVVNLAFIRLLCHERKISSCVDVAIAQATDAEIESGICDSYEESKFSRLGHVRFSTNEVSHYMARELKAVTVKRHCKYLKLVLRKPHHNTYNLFNQVGLVALTAHGSLIRSFNAWTDMTLSVPVGVISTTPLEEMLPPSVTVVTSSGVGEEHRSIASKRIELEQLKKRAVAEEDYDLAAALKKQIELLQSSSSELELLQQQKAEAVAAEDYARAKELKTRIEALHNRTFNPELQRGAPPTLCISRPATAAPAPPASPSAAPPHARAPKQEVVNTEQHDEVTVGGKGFYDVDAAMAKDTRAAPAPALASGKPSNGTVPESGSGESWEKALNASIATFISDQSQPTSLSGELLSDGKSYESDLGVYCVACLLGRRGQLREAAIRGSFAAAGAQALASHTRSVAETYLLYFSSKGHGVSDPVAGAALAACEAIEQIVKNAIEGWSPVAQLHSQLATVLSEVVARMGDSNSRVRESIESVIITIARSSVGPEKVVPLLLVDPDRQQKKPVNYRVHVSRINLLSTLVDDFGVTTDSHDKGLSVEALFTKVLTPCLQHSNAEVRDAAIKLFAKMTVRQPSTCRPLIQQFKPAQQALIEEQIALANHISAPSGLGPDMEADTVSVRSTPQGGGSVRHTDSDSDSATTQNSSSRRTSSQGEQESRRLQTCQFCGEYNTNFTEANLDLHYVRSCPMLCPCPLCDQVTEICTLQQHLVTECEGHRLVRECPRCHEAVRAEDIKKHIAAKACIDASPLFSVCPLCHDRFKSGMDGWRVHLAVAPGCPNNPRKYDGTGPIM